MNKKIAGITLLGLALVGLTSGCNFPGNKAAEPWNDAPIVQKHDNGAEVYSMPDGFNNFASKCDGNGHRVFTTYHHDSPYGGIAVIDDPKCGG